MKRFLVGITDLACAVASCAVIATGVVALTWLFCGCTSEYTGSRTIVGEQDALPELSDSSDSVSLRVYESVKGAKVWTAKDCNVTIAYTNAYTNSYFGVVETRDHMTLKVKIEPCEVTPNADKDGEPTAREGETDGEEPPPDGGADE